MDQLKAAGFKFNKTTCENGNPDQRNILFYYKDDFEHESGIRPSNSQNSMKTISTKITTNTGSVSKMSHLTSPQSNHSEKLMQSIKSTSSKYTNCQIPKITFHKYPSLNPPSPSRTKITSGTLRISQNDPRASPNPTLISTASYTNPFTIIPPNYYYRSNRYKNNELMDSIVDMDAQILRESQSLEELKNNMKTSAFIPFIQKPPSRMRNSASQTNIPLTSLPKVVVSQPSKYVDESTSPIRRRYEIERPLKITKNSSTKLL